MDDTIWKTRAMGILIMDEGVTIRAYPNADDRTDVELAPGTAAGAIVRDPATGRWRYDQVMRRALGIKDDPDFATDYEAGGKLEEFLPPLSQILAFIRRDNEGHG